jgi:hypothetical protein
MERPLTEYGFFRALCDLPFVEEIRLFGGRARGFGRPRSDIDLAIRAPGADAKVIDVTSPRGAFREAYAQGWLAEEAPWLAMIEARNLTSHT